MAERTRKAVGGMFMLTVVATLLLLPPFVLVFNHPGTVFGLPQIVVYLFAVWLAMIAGTALLTGLLRRSPGRNSDGGAG